jgi:D-3-phosphoglycerate dehydrogenase
MFHGAFRGDIIVYDPVLSDEQKAKWSAAIPEEQLEFTKVLDDLLTTSDIVSIHCPLINATRNLISDRELGIMKPTSIIINSARGGIIDEEALERALKEQKIYGAGLDATVYEPPSLTQYPGLCSLDNVVIM